MIHEERNARIDELFTEAFRQCVEEGLLNEPDEPDVAMIVGWAMCADTIDIEGETGHAFLHPVDQTLAEAWKLLGISQMSVEEGLRAWLRGEDDE